MNNHEQKQCLSNYLILNNYGMKIQLEDWSVAVVISGICIYIAIHKKEDPAQHKYVSSSHATTF